MESAQFGMRDGLDKSVMISEIKDHFPGHVNCRPGQSLRKCSSRKPILLSLRIFRLALLAFCLLLTASCLLHDGEQILIVNGDA